MSSLEGLLVTPVEVLPDQELVIARELLAR